MNIEGMDLFNYLLDKINIDEIKQIIVQLFLALFIAYKQYKLTHYDLHPKNIVIKRYDNPIKINYLKKTVETKVVPYIIDYERAHITLAGTDYGIEGLEEASFYEEKINVANRGFWPHDVFLILANLYCKLTLDGAISREKVEYENRAENIEDSKETMKDLKDELKNAKTTKEKEDLLLEIEDYKINIQNDKKRMKELEEIIQTKRKRWTAIESGNLVEITIKLISYLTSTPENKFDFIRLVKKHGPHFHLSRDKKNVKLNFEDFVDYTLKIIDI